jgi:mono/diheme cytochrome c family protein
MRRPCFVLLLIACALTSANCGKSSTVASLDPLSAAYDSEPNWNDPQKLIPLNYQQAQGKRVFYTYCVWCHADTTPAGPSNRSNLSPPSPRADDGSVLNALSEEQMHNAIALGGSAVGKSAMMPRWDRTLTPEEIAAAIAFMRAIAQPPYTPPARPATKYTVR